MRNKNHVKLFDEKTRLDKIAKKEAKAVEKAKLDKVKSHSKNPKIKKVK